MEESSPVLALHVSVSNSLFSSPMEDARFKLMADSASLLSDLEEANLISEASVNSISLNMEVHNIRELVTGCDTDDLESRALAGCEDEASVVCIDVEQLVESSGLAIRDDGSLITAAEELLDADTALIGVSGCMEATVKSIITGVEIIAGSSIGKLSASLVSISSETEDLKAARFAQINLHEGPVNIRGRRSVFALDYTPLWGCMSTCGKRPEMEDAAVAAPWFHEIPLSMLTSVAMVDDISMNSGCLPGHFFGVFDGHGGAQVANYCKDRMHFALVDEIKNINKGAIGIEGYSWQKKWESVFINCFQKVDDEVSGAVGRSLEGSTSNASFDDNAHGSSITLEAIIPETVGSTAVVAVICSSHIIVANCGDSRAVLCCGKQAIPLSVDHKPDREDEYQRIDAAGGKVIQWYGSRVFGVLAMSRAIGDRYLKPWIIPEPEVVIVPRAREDECLILASDGLWDVMSNEEACEVARKRILLWHKRNSGITCSTRRAVVAHPAAQEAADYLLKLALQKGSKDNITVVVVDLKAHRKFKGKT
ncbi:probable protein phosphatase 2C 50 [Phalaenopsis equestris]|uniref:probable protein phosphatase 2C 50 n=1 Tax=Phalaenopsis equestris TaxID=78828 RepID=UPI0009E3B4EB|nr:probable protein phosphatase 2C 50 [Phalaenopsis equestris]